jgi:hypothetical protein
MFVWRFWRALAACACALGVYGLVWMAQIVFVPSLGLGGILLRTIILSALIGGVTAEWGLRQRRKRLGRARQPGPPA